MREGGVEPPHPFGHTDLNRARLPIPPLARRPEGRAKDTRAACALTLARLGPAPHNVPVPLLRATAALLALAIIGSLAPAVAADASAPEPAARAHDAIVSVPRSQQAVQSPSVAQALPRAAAVIAGTPLQILNQTPVAEPMTVGYTSGLFTPKGAKKKKDKRGCTWRNQTLIKLATRKPRVGPGCTLTGGVWWVDFGRTKITKASQVKLMQLLPDNYVYAQGAYGWTPEQRAAYISTGAAPRRMRSQVVDLFHTDTIQALSPSALIPLRKLTRVMVASTKTDQATLAVELTQLRRLNPGLFDSWSVATLLNAKSWGLSLSPGTAANFQVSIRACAEDETRSTAPLLTKFRHPKARSAPASPGTIEALLCTTNYSVPNYAASYHITAIPQIASAQPGVDATVLAGYAEPTRPPVERTLFGIHAPADWVSDVASGYNGPIKEETIPDIPVGYLRLWDTKTTWRDLEPERGQWQWRLLDKQIEMAQILDANVMLTLGGTPAWADEPGDDIAASVTSPPKLDSWRNYVTSVCKRYGASITSYEVWNEANLTTFWTGTPTQMAELTKAAFEEIRTCNPNALVVAANTTSRATGSFGSFYPAYLAELKKRNWPVDAYSVHSYPTASGGADDRIKGIGQFRAMLALAGAPQTTVFDSEINYGLAGLGESKMELSGGQAMALLARTYIDSVRYDFGSTFWFVWTAKPDSKFGIQLTRASSAERQAWYTIYDWLVGARFQRCLETEEQVIVCQFSRGAPGSEENFSIVWRGDVGTTDSATTAGYFTGLGSRMCSLHGVCNALTTSTQVQVGPMPLRIDGVPLSDGTLPAPETTVPDEPVESASAPTIVRVDLVYSPSNKADAVGHWAPYIAESGSVRGFDYSWDFCPNGASATCTTVARGTTSPTATSTSAVMSKGPGLYRFRLRVKVAGTMSAWTQQDFTVLHSRVLPPSQVRWSMPDDEFVVRWAQPAIRANLVRGYEVQFRNVTANAAWQTLTNEARGGSYSITSERLGFVPFKDGTYQVGQVRVRTILNSGQKSVYAASEALAPTQLAAPSISIAAGRPNGAFLRATLTDSSITAGPPGLAQFPTYAYQVRYSNDNGITWTNATLKSIGIKGEGYPSSETTLIPFAEMVTIDAPGATEATRWEARTTGPIGRQPSDWVSVDMMSYGNLYRVEESLLTDLLKVVGDGVDAATGRGTSVPNELHVALSPHDFEVFISTPPISGNVGWLQELVKGEVEDFVEDENKWLSPSETQFTLAGPVRASISVDPHLGTGEIRMVFRARP